MHILELEHRIERDVQEIIRGHFPLDWKEDVISHELARRFRCYKKFTLYGLRNPLDVDWEIYKLHGKRETNHGDFGLLIRYRLPSGDVIEGAGFIEAKLRGRDSTKFQQVRHEQVTRILSRSPQTRLMLYDYNPVAVLDPSLDLNDTDYFLRPNLRMQGHGTASISHAPVLPLQLAATVNHYDDSLYRFCHSISHQFTRRYINLHDLDFSEAAVNAVKGYPSELGSPNYVMIIRATVQGQELPESLHLDKDLYGEFE
jgi:hypothetical protein